MTDKPVGFEPFFAAYLECAIWASTDDDGEPLRDCAVSDIAQESYERLESEALDFYDQAGALIDEDNMTKELQNPVSNLPECEQAGHDFWLTRNGHGCGFWDGDWKSPAAEVLTKLANSFSERYLYAENGFLVTD